MSYIVISGCQVQTSIGGETTPELAGGDARGTGGAIRAYSCLFVLKMIPPPLFFERFPSDRIKGRKSERTRTGTCRYEDVSLIPRPAEEILIKSVSQNDVLNKTRHSPAGGFVPARRRRARSDAPYHPSALAHSVAGSKSKITIKT